MEKNNPAEMFGQVVGLLAQQNDILQEYLTLEAHIESRRFTKSELVTTAQQLDIAVDDTTDTDVIELAILATLREKLWGQIMMVNQYVASVTT